MADTAKRLVGPISLNSTTTVVYTVPAATTTIVRNIHVTCVVGSVQTFSLAIGSASNTPSCLYYLFPVAPNMAVDWSGFLVLAAGENLQALTSSASAITMVISGIEVA